MKRTNNRIIRNNTSNNAMQILLGVFVIIASIIMVIKITHKEDTVDYTVSSFNQKYIEMYNVSEEFIYHTANACEKYNTRIDVVLAIMEEKTGCMYTTSTDYGKGLLEMRPSTVKWMSEETGYYPGNVNRDLETSIYMSVYLIDYYIGQMGNIEDAVEKIVGNEDPTAVERVLNSIAK